MQNITIEIDGKQHPLSLKVLQLTKTDKLLVELANTTPPDTMDTIVTTVAKWAEISESRVLVVDKTAATISILKTN